MSKCSVNKHDKTQVHEFINILKEYRFDLITKPKIKKFCEFYNEGLFSKKKCRICIGNNCCERIIFKLSISVRFDFFYDSMLEMTLIHAAGNGNINLLKHLLYEHTKLNKFVGSALTAACMKSQVNVIKFLLNTSDTSDAGYKTRESIFETACIKDNIEIANILIRSDRSLCNNKKSFHYACLNANTLLVKMIIRNGNKESLLDEEAFENACRSCYIPLIKYLLDLNTPISQQALFLAYNSGNLALLQLLNEYGADFSSLKDELYWYKIEKSRWDVIKFLRENGVDIKKLGTFELKAAASISDFKTVEYLLEEKVDIHANNERALLIALLHEQFDMANFLIKNGADIHVNNDEILMRLVTGHCSIKAFQFAIDHGVSVTIKHGIILSKICMYNDKLLECLKNNDFDFKKYGSDSFLYAVMENKLDIVKFLTNAGVDIYVNNYLAFTSAIDNEYFGIADFLLHIDKQGIFKNLILSYPKKYSDGCKILFLIKNNMFYIKTYSTLKNIITIISHVLIES